MSGTPGLIDVQLSDKFEKDDGRIFISGTQALARLALVQRELDQRQGLNTRGFISGYRGSPLGMLDNTLWREKKRMEEAGVVFQPGVNEDLAATAVWGTQQLEFFPDPQVDLSLLRDWRALGVDYLSINVGFDVMAWQQTLATLAAYRRWVLLHDEEFVLAGTEPSR